MRKLFMATAGALLLVQAGSVSAQGKNAFAMAADFAKSAKENAGLLRKYSWNMRVEVTEDGEAKPARLYLVRFTIDGTMEKTLLTPAPELHGGPFMRMIEKQKMASAKKMADTLAAVVKKYTAPTPGTMLDFFMKAKYTPAEHDMLEISGSDFVEPGDLVHFWVDKKTKKPHRFAFASSMDGKKLTGVVNYQQVPKGPLYAARIDIDIPSESESALIETFNYQLSN